jgi:hypothetical protein
MSLLANQTNINKETAFFLLANMSSLNTGALSTGQITTSSIRGNTATFSTVSATAANISSLTSSAGTFSSIYTNYLSSGIADLNDITTSTIFATAGVFINGAELTTAGGTELLLNGIPLATTSNLSSITDWALDPAISSVNMSGFDLLNTNLVSTINLRASSAFIQNLLAWNILAVSSFTSSISSFSIQTDELFVSSVKGDTGIFDNYLQTSSISSGVVSASFMQTSSLSAGNILAAAIQTSTINGESYPPPGTGSTISTFQTVTASQYISTPDLRVSSINGAELNNSTIIISTINTQIISTNTIEANLTVVSSIQLKPSVNFSPNLNVDFGLGSLFTNVAGAVAGGFSLVVGSVALATGVTALALGRQTGTTNNYASYQLVNTNTQLQISTLGTDVDSILRLVSSPNISTPGLEIFVSTTILAGTPVIRSLSDPLNTVSSPSSTIQSFGEWVALPETGAISTLEFSTLTCSTLVASELVSTLNIEVGSIISTNGLSAQFVIGEQLVSTPQLFVSSINNVFYPPPQEILSTFPGNIYVADSIFAANLLSTFNILAGNVISTNGLSAQYVIGEQLVSTPQLFVSSVTAADISTNNITLSTINGSSLQSYFPAAYVGQYYKSTIQTLNNGNTDVIFDMTQPWNNTGGYITHTDGTTDFTVVQPGLYQLEFNCAVLANGAVYSLADIGKSVGIDITRTGIAEQFVIVNTCLQASAQNYAQLVSATFYLEADDIINLRVVNTFTGGPPTVRAIVNTFDLNTFFTWTYIR